MISDSRPATTLSGACRSRNSTSSQSDDLPAATAHSSVTPGRRYHGRHRAASAQESEEGLQGARSGATPCPLPPRDRERIGAGRQHTAGDSVPAKRFYRNRPVAGFQAPAATGGNGAVTCTAASLPAGLVFSADGAGNCPGAEPREVCGTPPPPPPSRGGTQMVAIAITAQDTNADADRAASDDRDPLTLQVSVRARPTLAALSGGGVSGGGGGTARFTSARGGVVDSPLFRPPGR